MIYNWNDEAELAMMTENNRYETIIYWLADFTENTEDTASGWIDESSRALNTGMNPKVLPMIWQ